jgi:glutaminyl-peptide cyclotransferase
VTSGSSRLVLLLFAVALACVEAQTPAAPTFDGERALAHVRQLVAIGPRVAGSPAAQKARDYISRELTALGLRVQEQSFDAQTPLGRVRMVNLRATVPGPSEGDRLVIAGHYDTKLFRELTFVGANDGGSSTAFLIELARVLKDRRNVKPIELLFLDGEEAFVDWHKDDDNTYGSRHYVETARKSGTLKAIKALILVDMIGERGLQVRRERNSTPWLTDLIWTAAARLKRPEFLNEEIEVEDDHLSFLRAGVPAVDIIDLDYPAWHTADDTLDKLAPASLQAVGEVLLAALPDIEKRLFGQ